MPSVLKMSEIKFVSLISSNYKANQSENMLTRLKKFDKVRYMYSDSVVH
jgi:hypothetical protein